MIPLHFTWLSDDEEPMIYFYNPMKGNRLVPWGEWYND
jgi:hypothetical protein